MKKFLKHCNRGLLLGLAVLLGLIIYLKANSMWFEKSKAEIENTVTEYLTEVKKVNLAPTGEKISQCQALLERFWTSKGIPSGYYGAEKADMSAYLDALASQGNKTGITDYTDLYRDITVSQFGPGCAKAALSYNVSISLDTPQADCPILGLQDGSVVYYGAPPAPETSQINQNLSLEIYLQENDGKWQISSISAEPREE